MIKLKIVTTISILITFCCITIGAETFNFYEYEHLQYKDIVITKYLGNEENIF